MKLFGPIDLSSSPSRKRATALLAVGGYVNTGITILQGLFLIPLYLHYIGAHMYGLWLGSGGILGMLGLMNCGIGSLVTQRVARAYGQGSHAKAGAYFFNGATVYLGICLLYALAGWAISIWLPTILKVGGEDARLLQDAFQLAVVAMTVGIFNECLRSFGQALLRPLVPMASMAVGRVLGIFATVWMLLHEFGLWAIPAGLLIAEIVILVLNLFNVFALFRNLAGRTRLDIKILKEYARTSPALLMSRVGGTLSHESEPLLITMFLSPEVTTAYMVTRRAADIVFRLLGVIVGSTMGSFAHLAGCGDQDRTAKTASDLFVLSFSVGAVAFSTYVGANHAFISLWVGESFVLSQNIIFFIAIGFFARTLRVLLGQILYGLGDFVYTSVIVLLEGVARIALAMGLLNMLGMMGVPLAFVLSSLIAMAVLGFRFKKLLAMHFDYSAMTRLLVSSLFLFVAGTGIAELGIEADSWGALSMYLIILLAGSLVTYILLNWSRFRDTYKSVIA